jgi:hypothetical protein
LPCAAICSNLLNDCSFWPRTRACRPCMRLT